MPSIQLKVVSIADATYLPSRTPRLHEELLSGVLGGAKHVEAQVDSACFSCANLRHLQPFADGNERKGRLAAGISPLLHTCAPISFLDVELAHCARAMLG